MNAEITDIGRISVDDLLPLTTVRLRILEMYRDFGFGDIEAVGMTTALSDLLVGDDLNYLVSEVSLTLEEDEKGQALVISITPCSGEVHVPARFFSKSGVERTDDGGLSFTGKALLPGTAGYPVKSLVRKWTGQFPVPSPEALVINLQQKNRALEMSRSGTAALIDALPDLTIIYERDGTYRDIYRGQSSRRFHLKRPGRGNPVLVGRNVEDVLPAPQAEQIRKSIADVLESSGAVSLEYSLETDGGLRWYDAHFAPLKMQNRKEDLVVCVARDITDLKNLTMELAFARDEAEAATRAKGDFLANMSHEIRTPMNAIIGLSTLISRTEMTEKQQEYISKIGQSAKNLLGIINDILDFSKVEAGKMDIEEADFCLHTTLENLSNLIGEKVRDKGLELVFRQDLSIPDRLVGDPLRLGQILLNLTNNAVKFTDEGEILVSTRLLGTEDGRARIQFEVSDTGIGLTRDQQGKLFQSFSQADSSTTRKYGGTGLGLAISKRLSELMGGSIGVRSEYGHGSTFFFTVSLGIGEEESKVSAPDEIKEIKVLIVDDNEAAGEVLLSYLRDFSFEARFVSSGDKALRELVQAGASGQREYDLVLMDYQMSGMNGFETSVKIREELENVNQPHIIMITAFGREEIIRQADKISLDGFLIKPVSPSMLFDSIMQAFGKKKAVEKVCLESTGCMPEGFERIRGARILLTEDNEINQQVASETLEQEGFVVDIAGNGRLALDALEKEAYDCVLMDLQMPVMDGYEASRQIRMISELDDMPVIAMTADAMVGVRDEVLRAGMNDYVSKPFDPAQLWAALVKWITPLSSLSEAEDPGIASVEAASEEVPPGSDYIPDLPGVDLRDGLTRLMGNISLYRRLIGKFALSFAGAADEIREHIAAGRTEEALRGAHTVKGTAGNLGFREVQESAGALEKAIRKDESFRYEELTADLADKLGDVIDAIESCRLFKEEKYPSDSSSDGDGRPAGELLSELGRLLGKQQPLQCAPIIDELESRCRSRVEKESLKGLSDMIGRYRFKDARALLENLSQQMQ